MLDTVSTRAETIPNIYGYLSNSPLKPFAFDNINVTSANGEKEKRTIQHRGIVVYNIVKNRQTPVSTANNFGSICGVDSWKTI